MVDAEKFIEAFLATKTEDSYVCDTTKKMVIEALGKIGKKVVDGKIVGSYNLNIAKSKWNPGDKFRKKGTDSPIYIY